MRRFIVALLLLAGCESADAKAERAVSIELENRSIQLVIQDLSERSDRVSRLPPSQRYTLPAIHDSLHRWRVELEKNEAELRKLRR